jgi:hypothetical protein
MLLFFAMLKITPIFFLQNPFRPPLLSPAPFWEYLEPPLADHFFGPII